MGVGVITDPNDIIDWKWYHCYFHHYWSMAMIPCVTYVGDLDCCVQGVFVKWFYRDQCRQGGLFCFANPVASYKIKEIIGPYDSEADCLAGTPSLNWTQHFYTENLAYVIADEYGFFPSSESKFEMEIPVYGNAWSFHADNKNNLKLHVRFNPITVANEI